MLTPIIDTATFQGLDPILQAEYKPQDDGTYKLSVGAAGGYELANTANLLSSVRNARAERDEAATKLREMQGRLGDHDLDALLQAQNRLAELEARGQGNSQDAQALRAEIEAEVTERFQQREATLSESHQTELAKLEDRAKSLSQRMQDLVFNQAATQAILDVDKNAEPRFLIPELRNRSQLVEQEDGSFAVQVVGADGKQVLKSKNGEVVPVDLSDVVGELRKDPVFGRAFGAMGSGGSGATSGTGGPGEEIKNPWTREHLSLSAQTEIKRKNPELAARLQKEAGPLQRESMLPKTAPTQ